MTDLVNNGVNRLSVHGPIEVTRWRDRITGVRIFKHKVQFERSVSTTGPRTGWRLTIHPLRRGCGYRAYDFPWHSQNIADGRFRTGRWTSSIPGVTIRMGTNHHSFGGTVKRRFRWSKVRQNQYRYIKAKRHIRFFVQVRVNGNHPRDAFPNWWS